MTVCISWLVLGGCLELAGREGHGDSGREGGGEGPRHTAGRGEAPLGTAHPLIGVSPHWLSHRAAGFPLLSFGTEVLQPRGRLGGVSLSHSRGNTVPMVHG